MAQEIDKNIDSDRLSPDQKAQSAWKSNDDKKRSKVPFGNTAEPVPKPILILAGSEKVIENTFSNASIVIGKDRPNSIFSGYGGKGHQKCGTIDLVAGRVSAISSTTMLNTKGQEDPMSVDPNFEKDAARIYISEKTDIDDNFKLRFQEDENPESNVFKPVHKSVGRSGIGIKADAVRIVGNEGVRIVTGVYEKNSRGGDITKAGIELVALNGTKSPFDVQPFVKGNSFVEGFYEFMEHVFKLSSLIKDFIDVQSHINFLFSEHNHNQQATMEPTLGPALGTVDAFQEDFEGAEELLDRVVEDIDKNIKNLVRFEEIYLSPASKDWILSRYNGTN